MSSFIDAHCDPDPVCDHSPTVIESDGEAVEKTQSVLSDVYFLEKRGTPGVCVESGQSRTWTPILISQSGIWAVADTDSDNCEQDDVVDVNECVVIDYLPINGLIIPCKYQKIISLYFSYLPLYPWTTI